jgi:hypothetical protein
MQRLFGTAAEVGFTESHHSAVLHQLANFFLFDFGARSGSFKPLLDSSHSFTSTPCFSNFALFASK